MARPRMQVTSVTIGTPDPKLLARFYERLLGWSVSQEEDAKPGDPPQAGWVQLRSPDERGLMRLNFEYEREYVPPVWPSEPGKQHITEHLDIAVEKLEEAVEWALGAGATLAGFQPQEDVRVMLDPSGHPFCLFEVEG